MSGANSAVASSDSAVATATASSGVLPGVYHLQIVDAGSQAVATSQAGGADTITDPAKSSLSTAFSYTLTANGKEYDFITPSANTLTGLAEAINTATKGDVRATIVNVGTAAAPSYQLSLQNAKYGALPITLTDSQGGPNLLGAASAATSVKYRINGQPAEPAEPLSSDTRSLVIAPNLTVTALKSGSADLTRSRRALGRFPARWPNFVQAYNAATQSLDAHRGTGGGALAGQSIVSNLSESLRDIANYAGNGAVSSLFRPWSDIRPERCPLVRPDGAFRGRGQGPQSRHRVHRQRHNRRISEDGHGYDGQPSEHDDGGDPRLAPVRLRRDHDNRSSTSPSSRNGWTI